MLLIMTVLINFVRMVVTPEHFFIPLPLAECTMDNDVFQVLNKYIEFRMDI